MNSTPNTDGFIYIVTLRAVTATLRDLHSGYQIGTACAGSNPAVRVPHGGRARVVKGFDSKQLLDRHPLPFSSRAATIAARHARSSHHAAHPRKSTNPLKSSKNGKGCWTDSRTNDALSLH